MNHQIVQYWSTEEIPARDINKGRRTGTIIDGNVKQNEDGFEDHIDFWAHQSSGKVNNVPPSPRYPDSPITPSIHQFASPMVLEDDNQLEIGNSFNNDISKSSANSSPFKPTSPFKPIQKVYNNERIGRLPKNISTKTKNNEQVNPISKSPVTEKTANQLPNTNTPVKTSVAPFNVQTPTISLQKNQEIENILPLPQNAPIQQPKETKQENKTELKIDSSASYNVVREDSPKQRQHRPPDSDFIKPNPQPVSSPIHRTSIQSRGNSRGNSPNNSENTSPTHVTFPSRVNARKTSMFTHPKFSNLKSKPEFTENSPIKVEQRNYAASFTRRDVGNSIFKYREQPKIRNEPIEDSPINTKNFKINLPGPMRYDTSSKQVESLSISPVKFGPKKRLSYTKTKSRKPFAERRTKGLSQKYGSSSSSSDNEEESQSQQYNLPKQEDFQDHQEIEEDRQEYEEDIREPIRTNRFIPKRFAKNDEDLNNLGFRTRFGSNNNNLRNEQENEDFEQNNEPQNEQENDNSENRESFFDPPKQSILKKPQTGSFFQNEDTMETVEANQEEKIEKTLQKPEQIVSIEPEVKKKEEKPPEPSTPPPVTEPEPKTPSPEPIARFDPGSSPQPEEKTFDTPAPSRQIVERIFKTPAPPRIFESPAKPKPHYKSRYSKRTALEDEIATGSSSGSSSESSGLHTPERYQRPVSTMLKNSPFSEKLMQKLAEIGSNKVPSSEKQNEETKENQEKEEEKSFVERVPNPGVRIVTATPKRQLTRWSTRAGFTPRLNQRNTVDIDENGTLVVKRSPYSPSNVNFDFNIAANNDNNNNNNNDDIDDNNGIPSAPESPMAEKESTRMQHEESDLTVEIASPRDQNPIPDADINDFMDNADIPDLSDSEPQSPAPSARESNITRETSTTVENTSSTSSTTRRRRNTSSSSTTTTTTNTTNVEENNNEVTVNNNGEVPFGEHHVEPSPVVRRPRIRRPQLKESYFISRRPDVGTAGNGYTLYMGTKCPRTGVTEIIYINSGSRYEFVSRTAHLLMYIQQGTGKITCNEQSWLVAQGGHGFLGKGAYCELENNGEDDLVVFVDPQ